MKININTRAKVTLTERGAKVLNDYNRGFHLSGDREKDEKMFPTKYKEGDAYEDELWSLMHIFGPHIYMGAPIVFTTNDIDLLLKPVDPNRYVIR